MYNGKIGKYRFELDDSTNRIMVYEEGKGVEPVEILKVEDNLTEKDFHYTIMEYFTKNNNH